MSGGEFVTSAHLAILGDYNPDVVAHQGIEASLKLLRDSDPMMAWRWCHTSSLTGDPARQLAEFTGIWVVPASPYQNPDGVFRAIEYARRRNVPFLGTCGGFQHAVIEFARNVLGLKTADHAETAPEAEILVVTPLSCSLVEQTGVVVPVAGTRVAVLYGKASDREGYHCSYGLNPAFTQRLEQRGLVVAARDDAGEVRALELDSHRWFVLTLFQPERRGPRGEVHPVVRGFVRAALPVR
jgi:CTP synthase (UTP-ammonia lyase)